MSRSALHSYLVVVLLVGCVQERASQEPVSASESGAENEAARSGEEPRAESVARPARPRFTHVPRAYPEVRIAASRIGLEFVDSRANVRAAQLMLPAMAVPADGEIVEVALPAGYDAVVQERLAKVAAGSGPEIKLVIEVRKLAASRQGEKRRLDIDFGYTVQDVGGNPLVRGAGQGEKELLGPPYDSTELDDLHRAACIDALDVFLASESNIELINGYLTHR